jgi:hypothetical protein
LEKQDVKKSLRSKSPGGLSEHGHKLANSTKNMKFIVSLIKRKYFKKYPLHHGLKELLKLACGYFLATGLLQWD